MNLTPDEHDALTRLARHGAMPLGHGPDCVPLSVAARLSLAGFVTLAPRLGGQEARITRQGKAFSYRTVR